MAVLGGAVAFNQFRPGEAPGYLTAPQLVASGGAMTLGGAPYVQPRVVQPSGYVDACPVILERNVLTLGRFASVVNAAPHANTQRWTYVVPAGRRAVIQGALLRIMQLAPGNLGFFPLANLVITPRQSGIAEILQVLISAAIAAGTFTIENLGASCLMTEGDVLTAATEDPDTAIGGRRNYSLSASIREFDA